MLRIISGTDRSDKTVTLAGLVKDSLDSGRQVYILIPDQFSLVYDRKIYDILGARDFNRVNVLGLSRLSQKLIEKYGSEGGQYCDDNTRLIMMHRASKALMRRGGLRYYKKTLGKAEFFSNACSLISELRQDCVTPQDMLSAGELLSGTVSDKLYDLASLYALYEEELSSHKLKDTNSKITEAARIISQNSVFADCDVYIDSFSGFSHDQLYLLEEIFTQACDITACLTIGDGSNLSANLTPFALTLRTKSELTDIAQKTGHTVSEQKAEETDFGKKAIRHLSDNIFAFRVPVSQDSEGVKIVHANDEYSQAQYVFSEIARLVRDEKLSYSEIAIISRNLEDSHSLLEDMAQRYDVPLFCDVQTGVAQSAPVLFINSVFESIITSKPSSKNLLCYIKSPLSNIEMWEAALIEDYVFKWSVDGDVWLSDFTASDAPTEKKRAEELIKINEIRRKIIEPLVTLQKGCEDTTAAQISLSLNEFLRSVDMNDKTFSDLLISSQQNESSLEAIRIFKQLWTMLLSAITSIYEVLADEPTTLKEYYELLKSMLSQMKVSSPPQKLSAVIAASAEHTRVSGIKAAFIIGANDGDFPKTIRDSGLFTDREKAMLERASITMERRLESSVQRERFTCYCAMTVASDRLYICYTSANSKGEQLRPSQLVHSVNSLYKDDILIHADDMPIEFYCPTRKAAFYKYSELSDKRPELANAIKEAIGTDEPYSEKFSYIESLSKLKEHSLSEKTAGDLFWHGALNLSATKLDSFYRCPFSYFCKYGLKISPTRKVELSPLSTGSIAHLCLEKTMSVNEDGQTRYNSEFTSLTDEQIQNTVSKIISDYVDESLGGDFAKSSSFRHTLGKLSESVTKIVLNVREELCSTDFVPEAFEFSLTDEDGNSILPLTTESGRRIELRGFIDRVDFLRIDSMCYVRVVDYKTGNKSFRYRDIYNGINQQMLIYLLAITETANRLNPSLSLIPAGIVYMNAYEDITVYSTLQAAKYTRDNSIEGKLLKKKLKAYKRNGIVTNDLEIAKSMDKNGTGAFSPVTVKKGDKDNPEGSFGDGSIDFVLSESEIKRLCQFTRDSVVGMGNSLEKGFIPAMPKKDGGSYSSCDWCDYASVCGMSYREDAPDITAEDDDELLRLIRDTDKEVQE